MWSVPFDHNLHINWASAGIGSEEANENLFNKLYTEPVKANFNRSPANNKPAIFEYNCY